MSDLETTPDGFVTATKTKITAALAVLGAGAGAATGVALISVGSVFSGSPNGFPLDAYLWVAGLFAVIGAVVGPPVTWSTMRTVPIWRALVEPAAAAVLVGAAAMMFASALAIPFALVGGIGAVWRLNRLYRDSDTSEHGPGMTESSSGGSA